MFRMCEDFFVFIKLIFFRAINLHLKQSHGVISPSGQKGARLANKKMACISVIHHTYGYFNEIYFKSMLKMKQLTLTFYVQFKFPLHKKQKKCLNHMHFTE